MLKPGVDYLFDLGLEILNGCRQRCYGCTVDKGVQDGYLPGDAARLLAFAEDARDNGLVLANLSIGPTDFMVSNNTIEMMEESKELIKMFAAINLQSTFTAQDEVIVEWARKLKPYIGHSKLKMAFPLDPRHYNNTKYIEQTFRKIRLFMSELPDARYGRTIVLLNLKSYDDHNDDPINHIVQQLVDLSGDDLHVDLIMPDGRLNLDDPINRQQLRKTLRYLNRLHDEDLFSTATRDALALDQYYAEKLEQDVNQKGRPYDDFDIIYRNGRLHHAAFFGEDTVFFHEKMRVPVDMPWTVDGLVREENRLSAEQLMYAGQAAAPCIDCDYMANCQKKKIIQVMNVLNTTECFGMHKAMSRFFNNN